MIISYSQVFIKHSVWPFQNVTIPRHLIIGCNLDVSSKQQAKVSRGQNEGRRAKTTNMLPTFHAQFSRDGAADD